MSSLDAERVAIIGHTGFVGSHLREAFPHANLYNSANIHKLRSDTEEMSFGVVFCACVPAVKWMANMHPDQDWATIEDIQHHLVCLRQRCKRFVLISTIDIHNHEIQGQREDTTNLHTSSVEPYGRHRYAMEQWCLQNISSGNDTVVFILRLPALFGIGLKKNIIFDLLHNRLLDTIRPDSVFQWYDLAWLVSDVYWIFAHPGAIKIAHLYPEPISTGELVQHVFPEYTDVIGSCTGSGGANYNHKSLYSERFARSKGVVLDSLHAFVAMWRVLHGNLWSRRLACTNLAWLNSDDDHYAMFV